MEAKHTQGEWKLNHNSLQGSLSNYIITESGEKICGISINYDGINNVQKFNEAEANAKLIVAAPEMLEALKMCINHVGTIANKSEPARNAYNKAKEIIQKATE